MDAMLKHMEVRDDGFLEVVLKRTKDFDEYIFQQIHRMSAVCSVCVIPAAKPGCIMIRRYLTLKEYLQAHLFAEESCCRFCCMCSGIWCR